MRPEETAALWTAIDDVTGGALYALRFECDSNGWNPHMWAQTPVEGVPSGLTRFMFLGTDTLGKSVYWDTVIVKDDTGLAPKIKVAETLQEARRAGDRLANVLDAMDHGEEEPLEDPADELVREFN